IQVYLLVTSALLGLCNCDKTTSTYAILPYENEIPHHPSPQAAFHHQPIYNEAYNDYVDFAGNNEKKKKFTFGRIMRAPFKALKGAGTYMMGMFDDMRTRFLELNGSIPPRSRVDHVKAGSENIFRQTFRAPPSANLYTVQAYYPPYQPTVQKYSEPVQKYSEPVKEYSSYQNVEVRANEENVADIGLTDAEIREIGNSIDDGYKTQDDFGLQSQLFHNKRGVELPRPNDVPVSREGKFKNFYPSPRDFAVPNSLSGKNHREFTVSNSLSIKSPRNFNSNNVSLKRPYPLISNSAKRREIVQQRSRHPLSETQRNQRSYLEDTGSYEYERPIPVPVPIAVNPARLVFPSIQNMHPVVGY
ncbi:hypothetical protein Anas_01818, partial [Armadillidium nasatum]